MSTAAPLWPAPIPIIGVTGKPSSGKTRFCLSISPGPRTLVYDLEQSSASYEYIGFERIDVQKEMQKWCVANKKTGYKSIDLWSWWLNHVRSLPSDKYDVIVVDPVTDLEVGLTDWVAANPTQFGHTAKQYEIMSAIMWGDVKHFEKTVLADICAKCQTFAFTAHVGAVFGADKKPTGELKAKGKESLLQLASLYLWMEREPDKNGVRPSVPTARVMKGRLEVGEVIDGEIVSYEVLPQRLPQATPKAIREYFKNPAGKRKATAAEQIKPDEMGADEKLRLETQKAQAEADLAKAKAEAAQANRQTVLLTAPDGHDPSNNDPQKWVSQCQSQMDNAATIAELDIIAPRIKSIRSAGFISEADLAALRAYYATRFDAIKASESATAS
jgi:hypothetical protein